MEVRCDTPVTGDSIKIEFDNQDLPLCDMMAFEVLPLPDYLQEPSFKYSLFCGTNNRPCKCNGTAYMVDMKGNVASTTVDG